jgi:magnesium-transporting ATPase (P-type)
MSDAQDGQDSATDEDVSSGVVAALYASVLRIFARYMQQWDTTKQMLGAEWELTLKSLWLVLVFIIVLMSVVVVTWLGISALLAYGLFLIATPIWGIILAVMVLHILAIFVLIRTIRGLFKEVGFSRSLAVFSSAAADE